MGDFRATSCRKDASAPPGARLTMPAVAPPPASAMPLASAILLAWVVSR